MLKITDLKIDPKSLGQTMLLADMTFSPAIEPSQMSVWMI